MSEKGKRRREIKSKIRQGTYLKLEFLSLWVMLRRLGRGKREFVVDNNDAKAYLRWMWLTINIKAK